MYEFESSDIITVEELISLLRISRQYAYQLLNSGTIKAFRIGRVWKIPKSMLDEFIVKSALRKEQYVIEE